MMGFVRYALLVHKPVGVGCHSPSAFRIHLNPDANCVFLPATLVILI